MSFGEPGGIDGLTAIMRLPLLTDEEDLRRMLIGASPSAEHLMTFMHEVTHHWCFRTGPVGSVVAYLECRAASSAYLAGASADPQRQYEETFSYVARSRGAARLLRPLAEGLALFSEFDLLSGRESQVFSSAYWAAVSHYIYTSDAEYVKAYRSGDISLDSFLDESRIAMVKLLGDERTRGRAVDRKYDLLVQPIDPNKGGYLPGYLLVKRLYLLCARQVPLLLLEPDLFLCYIIPYIYGDPVLGAALINPLADAYEAISAFADRLYERMNLLPVTMTEESLEGLQQSMLEDDPEGILRYTGITQADSTASSPVISQFMNEVELATHDADNPTGVLVRALIDQRSYMYLGELRANVRFDEGHAMIEVPGRANGLRVPVSKTQSAGNADTVHLISPVERNAFSIAALYERGDDIVALSWGRRSSEVDQGRMATYLLERRYSVAQTRELAKDGRKYIANALDASGYGIDVESLKQCLAPMLEKLYFSTGQDPGTEDELARIRTRMTRYGVGGLLSNPDLVRTFARLGLANSLTRDYKGIAAIFEIRGWGSVAQEISPLVQEFDLIWPLSLLFWGSPAGDKYMLCLP